MPHIAYQIMLHIINYHLLSDCLVVLFMFMLFLAHLGLFLWYKIGISDLLVFLNRRIGDLSKEDSTLDFLENQTSLSIL